MMMVKRIFMGIVWFFIFPIFFGFIGGLITSSFATLAQSQKMMENSSVIIVILSLCLSVWGTITGKLPGTKGKK